jgi:hypothetical protein
MALGLSLGDSPCSSLVYVLPVPVGVGACPVGIADRILMIHTLERFLLSVSIET